MDALTRTVAARFTDALCAATPDVPIDLALARAQHAAYCQALADAGAAVTTLPAADALPDSCFVEDTAVVAGGVALITRPGAPSRRAEPAAIAEVLGARFELAYVEEPATLDGGDCMRVGTTIYVGRSARTNSAGIARLAQVFEPRGFRVVAIDLAPSVLHLKCVCAPLGDDRITLAEGSLPREHFAGLGIVDVPAAESYAANVVAIGGRVLASAGYPRTHEALARAGFLVHVLDTSEFRKADGALTCLSILS
jgi:dimethylargininase